MSASHCSCPVGALFHDRDEELRALLRFCQDTVQAGARVLLVHSKEQQAELLRLFGEHCGGIDTSALTGHLQLYTWKRLRKGSKEPGRSIIPALLDQALTRSAAGGCHVPHLWCDMAWISEGSSCLQYFTEYESQLTDLAMQHNCSIVCSHNLARLSGQQAIDILRCHPMILAKGVTQANPLWTATAPSSERLSRGVSRLDAGGIIQPMTRAPTITVSELRRSNRDLVALSMLPATWRRQDPARIIGRVAETLGAMLDAEFVFSTPIDTEKDELRLVYARSDEWIHGDAGDRIRAALEDWRPLWTSQQVFEIVNPAGFGMVRMALAPVGRGDQAFLVVGSCNADFPTSAHRLLLRVGANQAAISIQRWRAETEEHRFTTLVAKSSDFIGIAGLDGRPQYVNPAGLNLVGLDNVAQAQSTHILDFVVDADREPMRDEYWPVVMQTGHWRGELRFRHFRTGAAIPFLVDWFRIDDQRSGVPAATATVSRDLTAQKQSEAELRMLNETLEQRVVTRTNALVESNWNLHREAAERRRSDARLQELQSELFHAARFSAMGQMAGALAHELNQPLGAIINYVNAARRLLVRGEWVGTDGVRENIDNAAGQVQRAGRIIRRLRNFVTTGETEPHIENVGAMIEVASSLALIGAAPRGIEISSQIAPDLPLVFVDRIQIQQVIVNLLRNAIEAMADSEQRELVLTATAADGKWVEIVVSDTGSGLPRNVANRLFEPFVTSKRQGMGLGLSISRSIVEAHGGRLRHEPREGGGTIFRFTVPSLRECEDSDDR
jgi:PAS domain S-box-containing protein